MSITYRDAGVDIDAGRRLVENIGPLVAQTQRQEVLGGLGGFAGLCSLPAGYTDPVLVSGTDGVGTKLKTAFAANRHQTVGIDLVAMVVNDVAVMGAEPLFFLDYFATGKLEPETARDVVSGMAEGCKQAGCALLGGETAELPGLYQPKEYDLAGFCVGIVERAEIRDGRDIAAGDAVIGLASTGLHSNGHSLARMALLDKLGLALQDCPYVLGGASVVDELLKPTQIYVAALAALRAADLRFKAAAHITGGGLIENCPRVFPKQTDLAFALDSGTWACPSIFELIASAGVSRLEMERTFNLGIGLVLVTSPGDADKILAVLEQVGQKAQQIGTIEKRGNGGAVRLS